MGSANPAKPQEKKPQVDRLAIFLDKIVADAPDEVIETKKVNQIMQRLFDEVFTNDPRFPGTFERPPTKMSIDKGSEFLEYNGNNKFVYRLMLKRYLGPDTMQVDIGGGLPPGTGMYKLSNDLTKEQSRLIRWQWEHCLDSQGRVSPHIIHSWMITGIAWVFHALKKEDKGKSSTDERISFADIEISCEFPKIRLTLTPKDKEKHKAKKKGTAASGYESNETEENKGNKGKTKTTNTVLESVELMELLATEESKESSFQSDEPPEQSENVQESSEKEEHVSELPVIETLDSFQYPRGPSQATEKEDMDSPTKDPVNTALKPSHVFYISQGQEGLNKKVDENENKDSHNNLEGTAIEDVNDNNEVECSEDEDEDEESMQETYDNTSEYVTDSFVSESFVLPGSDESFSIPEDTWSEDSDFEGKGRLKPFESDSEKASKGKKSAHKSAHNKKAAKTGNASKPKPSVVIDIIPSIYGLGWPKGVNLQHLLPNQKPYCHHGVDCLERIQRKIEDGRSLWHMDPYIATNKPNKGTGTGSVQTNQKRKSPPLWQCKFGPVEHLLVQNVKKVCKDSNSSVNVDNTLKILHTILQYHKWEGFSNQVLERIVIKQMKRHIASNGSLKDMWLGSMKYLQQVAISGKCPSLLQPNMNIMQNILPKEKADEIAKTIDRIMGKVEKMPAYVLKYIGYHIDENDEQEKKEGV